VTIYLDNNATSPLHETVLEAMLPYMGKMSANPSSLHRSGRLQRDAIEHAREQVAQLVDARSEQVVFTSGGTEANNLLIKGLCAEDTVKRIAVSAIEHMSVLEPVQAVSKDCSLDYVAVNESGLITRDSLERAIKNDTALVSVMSANNETGVIQDIEALTALTLTKGIWFHTDASQSAGKTEISFAKSGVHAMTLSAHKLYGPMGIGALIVDKRLPLKSLMQGGSQEKGLRAGTENVPAIVGFGMAAQLANNELEQRANHVRVLRDTLQNRLADFEDVIIFSEKSNRLPNTLQFGVFGFDGETLLMQFDRHGVAVSSGSACTSGKSEPSHVLQAMQVPTKLATSAVRVSFGRNNTITDVEVFVEVLAKITEMKNSSLMMAATV
jgi:cysteine desulfurase